MDKTALFLSVESSEIASKRAEEAKTKIATLIRASETDSYVVNLVSSDSIDTERETFDACARQMYRCQMSDVVVEF